MIGSQQLVSTNWINYSTR